MKFYHVKLVRTVRETANAVIAIRDDEDPATIPLRMDEEQCCWPDALDWDREDDASDSTEIDHVKEVEPTERIDFQSDKARAEREILTRDEVFTSLVRERIQGR